MPRSEARRQKQLAKQKARRNAKRNQLQRERSLSTPARIAAPGGDIIDCLLNRHDLQEQGIANAVCAVRLRTGEIGVVVYLIDRWCLGVKNVRGMIMPAAAYGDWIDGFRTNMGARSVSPATLRRLLDDVVEFARSCGQSPYPDYARFQPVLSRVDPSQAKDRFEMGHNGKPHFYAGPSDDAGRCNQILSRLTAAYGAGNFEVTIPVDVQKVGRWPYDLMDDFDPGLEDPEHV